MHPVILNLGCGSKTAAGCVNIDWSLYAILQKYPLLRQVVSPLIGQQRRVRLDGMAGEITAHNLRKGIPFADNSVDAVYHSHMIEHIDREFVEPFFREVARVLKPGGVHRFATPDFGELGRLYVASIDRLAGMTTIGDEDMIAHEARIAEMIEQSVRRDAGSAAGQGAVRRTAERILVGDARRRGETHHWAWDEFNARFVLRNCGFAQIAKKSMDQSDIPGWAGFGLERDGAGHEYKPGSLYMECVKS
jgi:SAM-dependent methyltransferase